MHCTPPDPSSKPKSKMNFNDPFGRLQHREAADYAAVCESLRKAGVERRDQAEQCLRRLLRNGVIVAAAVSAIQLAVMLLAPAIAGISGIIAGLILFWVGTTTLRSRRHVRRFMTEALDDGSR